MNIVKSFKENIRKARVKNLGQLIRAILLRVWPLSNIIRFYYRIRFGPIWRRANRDATLQFERCAAMLDPIQQRAVEELNREGIYVTLLEDLLGDGTAFNQLQREAERLLGRPDIQKQVRERRSKAGHKWYVVRAFGFDRTVELPKCLVELVLNERILDIVNGYLGMWCRLLYTDVWYNLPVNESEPGINSERWHRDNGDHKLVKLFLYLNDVDEGMGPFTYMRETQPGAKYGNIFPANPAEGFYPPDGAIEHLVPATQARTCTGKSGTIILCDSSGIHKGGRSTTKPRILLTATYASNGAIDPARYRLLDPKQYESSSRVTKYAIRYPLLLERLFI